MSFGYVIGTQTYRNWVTLPGILSLVIPGLDIKSMYCSSHGSAYFMSEESGLRQNDC